MINDRKILVIDDDDDLRQSLEEQLAMSGEFRVVTAETAAKGIELIKIELPDLIVLDLGLPDMDGREVCKHLRKHGFKKPILMLTGNSSDADQVVGFDFLQQFFARHRLAARSIEVLQHQGFFLSQVNLGALFAQQHLSCRFE
jgi:DNA-binding response OmpR family regulator